MIKDGGLSFETQLKIEFLPPNKCSEKCLEKSLMIGTSISLTSIFSGLLQQKDLEAIFFSRPVAMPDKNITKTYDRDFLRK